MSDQQENEQNTQDVASGTDTQAIGTQEVDGVEYTYDEATRTFHGLSSDGHQLHEYTLAADETYDAVAGLIMPAGTKPEQALLAASADTSTGDQSAVDTATVDKEVVTQDQPKTDVQQAPEQSAPQAGGDAATDTPQPPVVAPIEQAPEAPAAPVATETPAPEVPAAPVVPETQVVAPEAPAAPAAPVDAGASGQVVAQDQTGSNGNAGTPEGAVGVLQSLIGTVSADTSAMIHNILDYMTKMKPRVPGTQDDQVRHQVSLFRSITGIINRAEDDFGRVWSALLGVVHEHRDGVFHERYVFRHTEHIPLGPNDRAAFTNVLNMMKLTADPQSRREALKQLDFGKATQHGLNDAGRNRLGAFYGL